METEVKKICHVTSVHPRYDGRIFRKMCVSLANKGYNVVLLCMDGKGDEFIDGVQISSVKYTPKNKIDRILNSSKKLLQSALAVDADLYHLHDPELLFLGEKLIKYGKKVIFDAHEDYKESLKEKEWALKIFNPIISAVYGIIEKRILKMMSAVISVTPHIVDRLSTINAKTYMVTNYPIVKPKKLVKKGDSEGCYYICFAGGLSRQWCHHNVIRALENINGVKYLVAGKNNAYFESLKEEKGYEKVEYIGQIPFLELENKVYDRSIVGIALNDYVMNVGGKKGSLGNTKLFEYMAYGLPVICTDFDLWKEIVEGENIGVCVDPNDVQQIKNAIEKMISSPELREEMAKNAFSAVNADYSWSSQAEILFGIYENILYKESKRGAK